MAKASATARRYMDDAAEVSDDDARASSDEDDGSEEGSDDDSFIASESEDDDDGDAHAAVDAARRATKADADAADARAKAAAIKARAKAAAAADAAAARGAAAAAARPPATAGTHAVPAAAVPKALSSAARFMPEPPPEPESTTKPAAKPDTLKRGRTDDAPAPPSAKRVRPEAASPKTKEPKDKTPTKVQATLKATLSPKLKEVKEAPPPPPPKPSADHSDDDSKDSDDDDGSSSEEDAAKHKTPPADKPRRVTGNKELKECNIPPEPRGGAGGGAGAAGTFEDKRRYRFRITLTNPTSMQRFLCSVIKVVPEMRFHLICTPTMRGFRMEAHDAGLSLAAKSRYECDLEAGTESNGTPLDDDALNGISFCVQSELFGLALKCATRKETVMHITQYHATVERPDADAELTFETVTDEGESYDQVYCPTVASRNSQLQSLSGISIKATEHSEVSLTELKQQCANAKEAKASSMVFSVARCVDEKDPDVIHNRIAIGFRGMLSGNKYFFTTMRRVEKGKRLKNGAPVMELETVTDVDFEYRKSLPYVQVCTNTYDSKKLRVFIKHMDAPCAVLHMTDRPGEAMPLIIEVAVGSKRTKHLIIVAAREESETAT